MAFASDDLLVEIFLFDQNGAVLADDGRCEVCNPCSYVVPVGAHELRVGVGELVLAGGGTWPSELNEVKAVILVDHEGAAVTMQRVAGVDPAVNVSATYEARSLPSREIFGGGVTYEAADHAVRALSSSEGTEIVVVHPDAA